MNLRNEELLLLAFAGAIFFLGGLERLFQSDHVFAGAEGVERFDFPAEFVLGVVCSLDREADAAFRGVHLDHASFHFLADFQDVLHLGHVFLADLRDVHETVDVRARRRSYF
jgi:hypothetical protein